MEQKIIERFGHKIFIKSPAEMKSRFSSCYLEQNNDLIIFDYADIDNIIIALLEFKRDCETRLKE